MTENNAYVILTGALFKALNGKRKNKGLPTIENALIATKLGILFTLKTHNYIDFKGEHVTLNDAQLVELQTIIKQHFNIDLRTEIPSLMLTQEKWREKMATDTRCPTSSSQTKQRGFFDKIKVFFKIKPKVQELSA